jgi:hypothetical protein
MNVVERFLAENLLNKNSSLKSAVRICTRAISGCSVAPSTYDEGVRQHDHGGRGRVGGRVE